MNHARDALALIREILAGRMPPEQRASAFANMAVLYPGAGWEAMPPKPVDSTPFHATHQLLGIESTRCEHCRKEAIPF